MMFDPVIFILLFFLGLVIDKAWYHIDYDKYEKGLEVHEHYHIGLEIGIIAVIFNYYDLLGLTLAFILAEWSQTNYFAYQSNHFKQSSIIGISLLTTFLSLYFIL